MRRVLIVSLLYAVLGPPIGWAALLLAAPLLLGQGPFDTSVFGAPPGMTFLAGLPAAYFLGLLPALLVATVYTVMERHTRSRGARIVACAAAGGLLSLPIVLPSYIMDFLHGPLPLAVAISGVCAGAACSLIASR